MSTVKNKDVLASNANNYHFFNSGYFGAKDKLFVFSWGF